MRARTSARVAPLLALVLAVVLAGCGSTHRGANRPSAPTTPSGVGAPASPSTPTRLQGTGTSAPGVGLYTWSRDTSPSLAIGGGASSTLTAVLAPLGRSPWTIAGTRLTDDGGTTATAWTSADGTSWTADPMTGPQVDSQADAATSWRSSTVIVGSVGPATNPSGRRAAVWISAGDASFAEVTSSAFVAPDSVMTAVTSGPLGLIAAGTAAGHIAMWYSPDGRHWTALDGADRLIGAADDAHIDTLLATTNEGVFAAGWVHSGSSIQAALWSSGDGIHWRLVNSAQAEFGGPGEHVITGMAQLQSEPSVSGTGLVAVGGTWTGSRWAPASWISPNGVSWSRPSTAFSLGARSQPNADDAIVRALRAIPSTGLSTTLVAVGGGATAQRFWKSTDGLHWTELPLPAAAAASNQWQASLLAVSGATTVIADGDPGQPHVLVGRDQTSWVEPSANPQIFGGVQPVARPSGLVSTAAGVTMAVDTVDPGQVIGSGSSSTSLLTSADGTNWSPIPTGSVFTGATVTGLATAPDGTVAVGWRRSGGTLKATAWISPSGRPWQVGIPLDPAPTAGSDGANAVCTSGREVVAVGWARSAGGAETARVWTSADGLRWTAVPLSPPVLSGGDDTMTGCSTVPAAGAGNPAGFDAFGTAASPQTGVAPAFWSSAQGRSWARQSANPFGDDLPFPTLEVARSGAVWMAATGAPDPDVPAAAAPVTSGLWVTTNAGASWQQIDTSSGLWQGMVTASVDQVGFLGSMPVVAGVVDGQLTVWVGVPT